MKRVIFVNIDHLSYVLEIYNCGSINKAAKYCFISQSHLSKIVKNLENELGYDLIIRSRAGISFTSAGKAFIKSAERIIAENNNIRRIPEELHEQKALSVVCSSDQILLNAFFRFQSNDPCGQTGDTLEEAGLRTILQRLISEERRLGIMSMYEQKADKYRALTRKYNICFETLQTHIPMVVVMNMHHPLVKREHIYLKDLNDFDVVVDANVDYDDAKEIMKLSSKRNILHVSSLTCTVMALQECSALSIKNQTIVPFAARNGLCTRAIEDFHECSGIYLLYPSSISLSSREEKYISLIKASLKSCLPC